MALRRTSFAHSSASQITGKHIGMKRAGYAALAVAVVSFAVAAATDFPALAVDLSVASLVVAIVVLPVPIVLGYGIRAAEREEREEGQRRYG